MFPPLFERGYDCITQFEAAAAQRFAEASTLLKRSRHLGAIYLFGYSVEMRLKALFFRNSGFTQNRQITQEDRRHALAMSATLGLPTTPGQHDLAGWAALAVAARLTTPNPYGTEFGNRMVSNATSLYLTWREILRYRASLPVPREIHVVKSIASWFQNGYTMMK